MTVVYIQWPASGPGRLGMARLLNRANEWAVRSVRFIGTRRMGVAIYLCHPDQAQALRSIAKQLGAERILAEPEAAQQSNAA